MRVRTCVAPSGEFLIGVHRPEYTVENYRETDPVGDLGVSADGRVLKNEKNFPAGKVSVAAGEPVFEVANPFPFRGTTYILKRWADEKSRAPETIGLPAPQEVSFTRTMSAWSADAGVSEDKRADMIDCLPQPLQLALAATSTDPEDLVALAKFCCEFVWNTGGDRPVGLRYDATGDGMVRPVIRDRVLFEVVANNQYLPIEYREVMVLRPGAQGGSEIVGEYRSVDEKSHVWEYLRGNSYIPWGHFAANMAQDSVRYRIADLTPADMSGMRHLYYQRAYTSLAKSLGVDFPESRGSLTEVELEGLRQRVLAVFSEATGVAFPYTGTLWGWNFGFDYAPSHYRLHASHQQIHQQFALLPAVVQNKDTSAPLPSYACGDQIQDFICRYYEETGRRFFDTYIEAIRSNRRMDGNRAGQRSLIVFEDTHCMLFVPKAQTSQWELNLVTLSPVGNILEADLETRRSIDRAMLMAVKALFMLGARMITMFEYSKRFDLPDADQRLLYTFLPRLPESPGAFSEAQLRWINGHYPEDFATACRKALSKV